MSQDVAGDASVRRATVDDLPRVIELYRELNAEDVYNLDAVRAIFARMADYPDYALYVAEAEGETLGTFTLLVMENLTHNGSRIAIIEAVAVAGEAQGRGIGRAMMRGALDLAREKGCYKASLSTRLAREKAHSFYEGLGFKKHGFSFYTELEQASAADEAISERVA